VIDLDERVTALRDLLISAVGGSIRLAADIPGEIWPIEADTSEL